MRRAGGEKSESAAGRLTGIVVYLAGFFSYALLESGVFVAALMAYLLWQRHPRKFFLLLFRLLGMAVLGALLCDALCFVTMHYNILEGYRYAMSYHTTWKHWSPTLPVFSPAPC